MTIQGNVITADEGKILTNGETYSTQVYLGIYDSPENWREIDPPEDTGDDPAGDIMPEEATEEDYAEALSMLGVTV